MSIWRKILLFPLTRLVVGVLLMAGGSWLALKFDHAIHADPKDLGPLSMVAVTLSPVLALLFVGRVMERKSLADLGLAWRGALARTGVGFLFGMGLLTATMAIFAAVGWYHVHGFAQLPPGKHHLTELLLTLALFFLVAVNEELGFRGVLFRPLEDGLGTWAALVITSALFGFGHLGNPNATWVSSIAIALEAGILLGAAYVATRSLWFVVGMHWAWNFFEGPVFSNAVSGFHAYQLLDVTVKGPVKWTGGDFGPEAGFVTMVLGVLLGMFFLRLAVVRKEIRGFAYWLKEVRAQEASTAEASTAEASTAEASTAEASTAEASTDNPELGA